MDIGVYRGHALAAAFSRGRAPVYRGAAGQEVKAVVERLAGVDALWSNPPAGDESRLLAARGFGIFCADPPRWGVVPLFPVAAAVGPWDGGAPATSPEAGGG